MQEILPPTDKTKNHVALLKSSALHVVLYYLRTIHRTKLQLLSRDFYNRIIPNSLYTSELSVFTKERLFSYSHDEGNILYIYDTYTL
jgi:hypothetical protein